VTTVTQKHKPGDYWPNIQKKGKQEACGMNLKDGTAYWTVMLADGDMYDTISQDVAEILSQVTKRYYESRKEAEIVKRPGRSVAAEKAFQAYKWSRKPALKGAWEVVASEAFYVGYCMGLKKGVKI
jgi:hypothetical protein